MKLTTITLLLIAMFSFISPAYANNMMDGTKTTFHSDMNITPKTSQSNVMSSLLGNTLYFNVNQNNAIEIQHPTVSLPLLGLLFAPSLLILITIKRLLTRKFVYTPNKRLSHQ